MKFKTKELTGGLLDWVVGECRGVKLFYIPSMGVCRYNSSHGADYRPSTNWAQGGPIIEFNHIDLAKDTRTEDGEGWFAKMSNIDTSMENILVMSGVRPLDTAMRCYVQSKLGDTVYIPDSIL